MDPLKAKEHGSNDGDLDPRESTASAPPMPAVGLHQVYPQDTNETATYYDIIAIHGLDTNSPNTWIWKDKSAATAVNWLKDPHMLPSQFPTARIFTCDWPADLFENSHFVQKEFEELARLLLAGIKDRSPQDREEKRPIVFIGSCLGGIILMKTLVMASHEYDFLKRATYGIIFLATPFRGTSFQDVAGWVQPGLRAWASIQGKQVSNMLDLAISTSTLGDLVRNFTAFCLANDLTNDVFAFYETVKTSLPRKIIPWLPVFVAQEQLLVDSSSATLDIIPNPLPLDRPHITMNKFSGPEDPGYLAVVRKIKSIHQSIRRQQLIEQADEYIRNNRYSAKNLQIERLSGNPLHMDSCYINLDFARSSAIITDGRQGEISPFSLFARLMTEIPNDDVGDSLPALFHCYRLRGPSYRILIRGQAGVGKTTLCKKIVHEFTNGKMWHHLFDRVLWIPLRNLKRLPIQLSPRYNFRSLFYDEYFSQHPEGKDFAKELWRTLEDTKSERTLFILDGLDEVNQDLQGDMHLFLKKLLDQPNVIITSRPHAMLPRDTKPVDLELKTVGFHQKQVQDYITQTFANPETGKIDSEKTAGILSYLKKNPIIHDFVRIPIQLDAFCFTWEDFSSKGTPQTMTAGYQAIELSLWRKDAIKLDPQRTEAQMQQVRPIEMRNHYVQAELDIVEALAFTGMYNNVIEFAPQHRDAILHLPQFLDIKFFTGLSLDEMLARISFLRTSDVSLKAYDQSYHFLHLTFQEYFAARYFVRQWRARKPFKCPDFSSRQNRRYKYTEVEPINFLREKKYTTEYDIFWRFVVGLLDDGDDNDKETTRFFEEIEKGPLDILGPMHQRLVMHCLREVQENMEFRKHLEEKLSQWFTFELNTTKQTRLATEGGVPGAIIQFPLPESVVDEICTILIESLKKLAPLPQKIHDSMIEFLKILGKPDMVAQASALGQLALPLNKSSPVRPTLMAMYQRLLHLSFEQHFGWVNLNGSSYIVMEDRQVPFIPLNGQVVEEIREAQLALGVPNAM